MILSEFRYDSMEVYNPQTCFQHPDREAVVRCPSCRKYYCRECVTEHDDRMLCSNCLAALTAPHQTDAKVRFFHLKLLLQGGVGFLVLWYLFFLVGQMLLSIPHSFHEGTFWQSDWWKSP
jgi:hypothetical protein